MKKGFTLLEVVLVVAISTLLFMSVTIGIGSRIATGRYETASTEIADYLRDVYTIALNTENSREGIEGARMYCTLYGAMKEGSEDPAGKLLFTNTQKVDNPSTITSADVEPGRTNCAIYGKAIYFGAKDGKVHVFDVVGNTVTNNKPEIDIDGAYTTELKELEGATTVLEQLEKVRAGIFAAIPENINSSNIVTLSTAANCRLSPAGAESTYEPNWGALFKTANFGGSTSRNDGDDFVGMVMVVRSPVSGNVSTFFYEREPGKGDWEFLDRDATSEHLGSGISCVAFNEAGTIEAGIVKDYSPVELIKDQDKRREDSLTSDTVTVPDHTGFCVGSDDFYVIISNQKKYVEFIPGGQNASAVKLVESNDKEENPCLR